MKFTIKFEREVIATDVVTRTIEADSLDEAQEAADRMATAFNDDCPDDAETVSDGDCQNWSAFATGSDAPDDADVDCAGCGDTLSAEERADTDGPGKGRLCGDCIVEGR